MVKRSNDYPTGSKNRVSFIGNRWVFTGPKGYRVVFDGPGPDGDGDYTVMSYAGAYTRPVYRGRGLTEDDAHALAQRLSSSR